MFFSIGLLIIIAFLAFKAAMNHVEDETFLDQYLASKPKRKPKLGGAPKETAPGDEEGKKELNTREASVRRSSPAFFL